MSNLCLLANTVFLVTKQACIVFTISSINGCHKLADIIPSPTSILLCCVSLNSLDLLKMTNKLLTTGILSTVKDIGGGGGVDVVSCNNGSFCSIRAGGRTGVVIALYNEANEDASIKCKPFPLAGWWYSFTKSNRNERMIEEE